VTSPGSPLVAVSLGDPAGIGAEVVAKALVAHPVPCRIFGDRRAFARAWERWGRGDPPPLEEVSELADEDLRPGAPTEAGLRASAEYVLAAVRALKEGRCAALCTAPLVKRALHLAGHHVPGHTELLQALSGAPQVAMMLAGEKLRVVLATTHCALREVPERLHEVDLVALLALVDRELCDKFRIDRPRLALSALNPHGGEEGLFGDEETVLLAPAVARARALGVEVSGPHPADTLFARAVRGEFDVVVALYHDQALIPLKLLHFGGSVNVTLGLPFVRVSPDHGVAYDIAGQGKADPGSMKAALRLAGELLERQGQARTPSPRAERHTDW
jgi:4-hydroxythreonine-4-phosphate dehydrogenase